jgi:hypothetical protein
MQLSELGLRLVLLFLPGILSAAMIDSLSTHSKRTQFQFAVRALFLGVASYLGLAVFHHKLVFFQALTDTEMPVLLSEVGYATAVAVVLGAVLTLAAEKKLLFRVARSIRLTRRFGDQDVWGYLLNSPDVEWVAVRDHKRGLVYDGHIRLFSDDSQNAELYLEDVQVYDNATGTLLYNVAGMYVALDRQDLTIEVRTSTLGSQGEREEP